MRRLGWFLALPGVHYLISRHAPRALKVVAFDERHRSGKWSYSVDDKSADLVAVIEMYANGGRILCLGCGSGSLARVLKQSCFSLFVGVDLSPVAIDQARSYQVERTSFQTGDIEDYPMSGVYSVIVFEESLYFIRRSAHLRILQRCREHLSPRGVIVLTNADPARFSSMQRMIRRNFNIIQDRLLGQSPRHLFVIQ
jgi:trans-aconitate methyltransferase